MKWNGQELANPRNSGRHEQQQGETGGASAPIQLRTNAELEWHMVWQGTGSINMSERVHAQYIPEPYTY